MDQIVPICQYVRVTGQQCGSPAVSGSHFCFFHERDAGRERVLKAALRKRIGHGRCFTDTESADVFEQLEMPVLEDAESVQVAFSTVLRALAADAISQKKAYLMLYGLGQVAELTKRTKFHPQRDANDTSPKPIAESSTQVA